MSRTFSRTMPPLERHPTLSWWKTGTLFAMMIGGIWHLFGSLPALLVVGACALLAVSSRLARQAQIRLATARTNEDIGTFARAFDRNVVDPFVIRAVYEGLQREMAAPVPVRPEDDLVETLSIDAEDLEDAINPMAERCSRDMSNPKACSLFGKIVTAADLVHFLNAMPKCSDPA
ncbi:hypothetical protein [uncultured Litoreibacter sp.]|uniref:hypothetical protein n=1 Tax=uncultured Litoreibacter sp. TaxID=1392394 RepID=UPI002635754B|nr:hypothetical protein [uncultured Litoreibacter sp.]